TIGSNDTGAPATSRPARRVALPPFAIDAHEVTNAQYCMCRSAGGCANDPIYDRQRVCDAAIASLPVTNVSLPQAAEYCAWIGRRLPTEIEWEWAARGADGRRFPTGAALPGAGLVNLHTAGPAAAGAAPGDRTPDSGVQDLAGNVQEWTVSLFLPYADPRALSVFWPEQVSGGAAPVVVRGGSWNTGDQGAEALRRYPLRPDQTYGYIGFRCLSGQPLDALRQANQR
ncbi:MAG TPA: SUMF1/EgtB/PvdO family nonheme iron enzyme, partial [Kouleothrix sp.]|nr:SUMF1/EgtB/PvdO family nonheme iron enzyme [Kouleothrix sp.]